MKSFEETILKKVGVTMGTSLINVQEAIQAELSCLTQKYTHIWMNWNSGIEHLLQDELLKKWQDMIKRIMSWKVSRTIIISEPHDNKEDDLLGSLIEDNFDHLSESAWDQEDNIDGTQGII